jgi:hypothetical protein
LAVADAPLAVVMQAESGRAPEPAERPEESRPAKYAAVPSESKVYGQRHSPPCTPHDANSCIGFELVPACGAEEARSCSSSIAISDAAAGPSNGISGSNVDMPSMAYATVRTCITLHHETSRAFRIHGQLPVATPRAWVI